MEGETLADDEIIVDGSILAKSLYVGDNSLSAFAEMAIFIDTTDDCFLVKDESKDAIRKAKSFFKDHIFANFEERLKIELALLYLRSLRNK